MATAQTLIPVQANKVFHINEEPEVVSIGSVQTRQIQVNSQSHSLSSTSFRYDVSPNVLVDRQIFLQMEVRVRVTGGTDNQPIPDAQRYKLVSAALPLHRVMKSLNVSINGTSLSVEPCLLTPAQNQYHSEDFHRKFGSLSPSQPDSCQSVAGMIDQIAQEVSPFNEFNPKCRANFRPVSVTLIQAHGAGLRAIWEYVFVYTEALRHPFLAISDEDSRESIKRAKNLSIDISWLNSWSGMFYNAGMVDGAGAACTAAIYDNTNVAGAKLLMTTFISPVKMPAVVSHQYTNHIVRTFVYGNAMATNDTATISTGNIALSQVPSRIMFYVTRSTDITAFSVPDCFARITSAVIRGDKDSSALSQANTQMLYDIAVQNGYSGSWQDFNLLRGSVCVLDLNQGDLGGYVAGTKQNFTFDLQVGFQNVSYQNATIVSYLANGATTCPNWRLVIVAEMDSRYLLDGNSAVLTGGIGSGELLSALQSKEIMEVAEPRGTMSGGSFRGFLRGIRKGLGSILPLASTALMFRNPAAGLALGAVGSALNSQSSAQDAVRQIGNQGFLGSAQMEKPLVQPSGSGFKLRG